LACAYCGAGIEQCDRLTLDHLKPHSKGGTNAPTNLVTCCLSCNSSRGNRSVASFARAVAAYRGRPTAAEIVAHVRNCAKRALPRTEARALIARRGTCRAALAAL
jgi:endonuclease I